MSTPFFSIALKQLYSELKTGDSGLSKHERERRLKKTGPNLLPKAKGATWLSVFLSQFKNPLIYVLIAAAFVSFASAHVSDGFLVIVVVVISVVLGFVQEYKAESALKKLRELVKYRARVLVDGVETIVAQEELVQGDVIDLMPGDIVPADARIFSSDNLQVIEAALTGESMPSDKRAGTLHKDTSLADRENMLYMGTLVARGRGRAAVTATGLRTEIGKIAELVQETERDESPLRLQLIRFGKFLAVLLIVINIIIFALGVLRGVPLFEMFLTSVAVVVASVPEGLLPAATVILAVGMNRIAKHNGLVRKMIAAETLGSVSVICTDKTGTLTKGEMAVAHVGSTLALKIGTMCNNAIIQNPQDGLQDWVVIGDPTERALTLAGQEAGFEKNRLEKEEPRISEIPFDSEYKYMATLHAVGGEYTAYIKGAPDRLLTFCDTYVDAMGDGVNMARINARVKKLTQEKRKELMHEFEKQTESGLRVLAAAYKIIAPAGGAANKGAAAQFARLDLNGCTFAGFIALKDPLRSEAKETIERCVKAGIKPVIVTGDYALTARAIAREVGLQTQASEIIEGGQLENMNNEELKSRVGNTVIFARVEPKHKMRIISAWQDKGHIVAMTGDGVNDAPALKRANIGVALGSGTDVAKETADLVLTDNNFKTIVEAVHQGRILFNNMRKVILYLLTDMFTEVMMIGTAVIFGFPIPFLPAQILWVNLIEDVAPAVALAFDDDKDGAMDEPPRRVNEPILNRNMKFLIGFFALIVDITLLAIFLYALRRTGDLDYARTIAFVGLGTTSLIYVYSVRALKTPIFKIPLLSNKFLVGTTIIGIALFLVAVYVPFFNSILGTVPLGPKPWLFLAAYAAGSLIVYEMGKWFFMRSYDFNNYSNAERGRRN